MVTVNDYVLASNVSRLQILRTIAIFVELCTLWLAVGWLGLHLPVTSIVLVIALHGIICIGAWYRYRLQGQLKPIEFALQLMLDTIILAALLYYAGGYTNPFVSLFLVPLVIAASVLSPQFTGVLAIFTVLCYSLLIFFYVPLPHGHLNSIGGSDGFGLHVIGMWFSFLLSVGLVVFFVVRMSSSLRERDLALARSREKAMQDEHLVALGTLATGAAHELGTPLSTMAVLINELGHEYSDEADIVDNVTVIRAQLDRCKVILSDISATTGQARGEGGGRTTIADYVHDVLQQWQLLRPDTRLDLSIDATIPATSILIDKTLTQAIINLLNNAADASPDNIEVSVLWRQHQLVMNIYDHGDGLDEMQLSSVGNPFYTTKANGHGLGLYLARSVIERYQGTLTINNRDKAVGVHVQLILPLTALEV